MYIIPISPRYFRKPPFLIGLKRFPAAGIIRKVNSACSSALVAVVQGASTIVANQCVRHSGFTHEKRRFQAELWWFHPISFTKKWWFIWISPSKMVISLRKPWWCKQHTLEFCNVYHGDLETWGIVYHPIQIDIANPRTRLSLELHLLPSPTWGQGPSEVWSGVPRSGEVEAMGLW